tara:strand:- start:159 stop:647 length:489 start_codon:yes stop_codon:yes gene_type:complete
VAAAGAATALAAAGAAGVRALRAADERRFVRDHRFVTNQVEKQNRLKAVIQFLNDNAFISSDVETIYKDSRSNIMAKLKVDSDSEVLIPPSEFYNLVNFSHVMVPIEGTVHEGWKMRIINPILATLKTGDSFNVDGFINTANIKPQRYIEQYMPLGEVQAGI